MEASHITSPSVTPFRHKDKATEGWAFKRKIGGFFTYSRFSIETINGVNGRMWERDVDDCTDFIGTWIMWEPLDGSEGWTKWQHLVPSAN